ncbi:hypothetical protein F53441_11178 [Fusarium austroafricanum]|uniref:Uncharacterized protein n=1 Tax=Fusarium austroafricanum TaxID=2364996 RepID=A0A8H4NQU6_9HYPO|nr:hypothetical protein F53441_11178 [Fusarium austroafricanum]
MATADEKAMSANQNHNHSINSWLQKTSTPEPEEDRLFSDDDEARPAKKLKTKADPDDPSILQSPAGAPLSESTTAFNERIIKKIRASNPAGSAYVATEVDVPDSEAADYAYAYHWLDFKTLNPNDKKMPPNLVNFMSALLERQKDKKIIPINLRVGGP